MNIKLKFNFLDRVELLGHQGDSFHITKIQISAEGTVLYALLKGDGDYLWASESELVKIEKSKAIGFKITIESSEV